MNRARFPLVTFLDHGNAIAATGRVWHKEQGHGKADLVAVPILANDSKLHILPASRNPGRDRSADALVQLGRHQCGQPQLAQRHLAPGKGIGVGKLAILLFRLLDDDDFEVTQVGFGGEDGWCAGRADDLRFKLPFHHLDNRQAVTGGAGVAFFDGAYILVAPHSADLLPLFQAKGRQAPLL